MSWATTTDVNNLTGTPVAEDVVTRAQALIELKIGRTEALATAEMSARDLEWLRRAVAYQAAWLPGQADLNTRLDVTQLSQDGLSTVFAPDAIVYAPLAIRALKKLSWMSGTRSIAVDPFVPTPRRRWPVGGPVIDYDMEPWQSLGGPWSRRGW